MNAYAETVARGEELLSKLGKNPGKTTYPFSLYILEFLPQTFPFL